MTYYIGAMPVGDHLEHHGIKGMRWGQRRFQNDDGSLTALGRARYGVSNAYGRVRGRVNTARNDIRRAGGVKAASAVSRRVRPVRLVLRLPVLLPLRLLAISIVSRSVLLLSVSAERLSPPALSGLRC